MATYKLICDAKYALANFGYRTKHEMDVQHNMKYFYLAAALLGSIIPYGAFLPWLIENGANLPLFVQAAMANPISLFAWLDVLITAITLIVFIIVDAKTNKVTYWYLALMGTLCVGVSCGLPLYLYLRTREQNARLTHAKSF